MILFAVRNSQAHFYPLSGMYWRRLLIQCLAVLGNMDYVCLSSGGLRLLPQSLLPLGTLGADELLVRNRLVRSDNPKDKLLEGSRTKREKNAAPAVTKSPAPAKVRKEFITLPVRHAARRAFEYKMCIEVYSVQYCAQRDSFIAAGARISFPASEHDHDMRFANGRDYCPVRF